MFNVGEYFETLRGLLRRVVEEVEAEIKQVEGELATARRVGAGAEELSAVRDNLYEDSGLGLRRRSTPISRSYSPMMERRPKSSRRLDAACSALGLRWWRRLC
jgi:hypothetical protein